jgi:hypothetical protein
MAHSDAAHRYGWICLGPFMLSTLGRDLNLPVDMLRCSGSICICVGNLYECLFCSAGVGHSNCVS